MDHRRRIPKAAAEALYSDASPDKGRVENSVGPGVAASYGE
jgi:hypothetical protein